jgi:DNA polymerase-1
MKPQEKKLFLLDAMALIYRAHFAFSKNPRINSKGLNTGSVLGFANSLFEILNKEKPSHIGVAFDPFGPTFRHDDYAEYKAQRQEMPEDIRLSVPLVKALLNACNIPILEVERFEADDVIGTLAKKACKKGFTVYMMTPDKDFAQLVEDCVFLYKPSYMGNAVDILGIPEVLKKFDIENVDQVRDILGLQGDASDNIPGIPGIGAKTAVKLLKEFGTVENLVANADKLKGKQRENVENFGAQGILSKQLATIVTDVPIAFDEEKLKHNGFDEEALTALFDELEFRTMAKRVLGAPEGMAATPENAQLDLFSAQTASPAAVEDKIETEPPEKRHLLNTIHDYHLIDTPALIQSLADYLSLQKEFCFDTETTDLCARDAALVGLAFSYVPTEAYYVPVPADKKAAQEIVDMLKAVLENPNIKKIGQNLKYDIVVLKNYGVQVQGALFDTVLAHYLFEPETRHNMDAMAENFLNYSPVSIESLIGKKGSKQGNMREADVQKVAEYAGEDADITLQLKHTFEPLLKEKGIEKLFYEVEVPLVPVLAGMEYEGICIDQKALAQLSEEMAQDSARLEQQIYDMAGQTFNIASPKQLGEVLFDGMKLSEKPKKTKSGQYATGEDILTDLAREHPIAQMILDFRQIQKLKSTYIDALPTLVSKADGRIHTSYNQAVAATGRLSSTNPNLQNIPIRTEKGREIRKAFVPRSKDYVLMSADYSQIELRILAEFSKDQSMISAFKEGKDIHAATAAKVFDVPLEQVTADQRSKAKSVNFGISYGQTAFGLARNLGISRTEAQEIINAYFKEFPSIGAYMDGLIEKARKLGYAETILGRRRYLRDINSRNATVRGFAERNAVNAPIQGSAADMIKVAMIRIYEWMLKEKLRSKMLLQVHDELVFDVHRQEQALMEKHIPEFMKNAIVMDVPIEVGLGFGENWLEAH